METEAPIKLVHFFNSRFEPLPNLSRRVTNVETEILFHKNRLPILRRLGARYVRIYEGYDLHKPLTPFYDHIDFISKNS